MHNITGEEVQNKDKVAAKEAQNRYDSRDNKNNQGEVQEGGVNNKNSGIIDTKPNSSKYSMPVLLIGDVDGGMDGGCKENHTNLQEGVTKGGIGLMFFMRGYTLTISQTLEPQPLLKLKNNNQHNNRFNN